MGPGDTRLSPERGPDSLERLHQWFLEHPASASQQLQKTSYPGKDIHRRMSRLPFLGRHAAAWPLRDGASPGCVWGLRTTLGTLGYGLGAKGRKVLLPAHPSAVRAPNPRV